MGNFNLPCELELKIYEQLLPRGPRLARIGGPSFLAGVHPCDLSGMDTLLQLNSLSRAVALRHLRNCRQYSNEWTQRLGLDTVLFNRHTDLVYFEANLPHRPNDEVWELGCNILAGLVMGAEFPNIMVGLELASIILPAAGENPVSAAMYNLSYGHLSNAMNLVFGQLPTPQLPRNLYLALGRTVPTLVDAGRPHAFQRHDHPGPEDIIAMADMTDDVQQTLHPKDLHDVHGFLDCFAGWAQIPGLQLPKVFFVRPT